MAEVFPRPFGRYTLLANLAQGGMGALYLACQGEQGMEKLCVIKTVLPHLADKEYVARFRDEAKLVVRLSHGNLVPVFDAGMAKLDGCDELYLAMDYVDGKDLRAVWNCCAKKGIAFPVDVAVYIAREICRGLHHAHTATALGASIKLVHRDVSPPNLLLSFSGEVKLTDFGLASSTMKTEKTAPGVVYGKVSYMSPEQARAEPLDGRTDMYAVAVILWELLTGKQVFPQNEPNLIARVREPTLDPPSQHAGRVPPALDAIVMKALAKDRTLRYADCEGFRAALSGFLAQTAPTTDNDRVARFLEHLFGDEIEAERCRRQALLDELANQRAKVIAPHGQTSSMPDTVELAPKKEVTEQRSGIVGAYLDGRYLVKRLIGEGGMGLVYEAEHVEIGRRVAVKVLHAAYTRQGEVVARFRAEARAATRIGHPHIIEVLDSGTTVDGAVYLVMEFLEGADLSEVIAHEGPLPHKRAIAIAREICLALAAAHKAGIVHRDMKPENVFLTRREGRADFVKVLDFGIAKTMDQVSGRVGRLTNPGTAMGTPEYMAPEQASGGPLDHRVDIYAVGAILYEMLSGRPPHEGKNIMEVLTRKATQAPTPLGTLRPDVPRELERVVMRALASDPSQRPSTMNLLSQELGRLSGQPEAAAASLIEHSLSTDRVPRNRTPVVVAGLFVALFLLSSTAVWLTHRSSSPVAATPEPEPQPQPAPASAAAAVAVQPTLDEPKPAVEPAEQAASPKQPVIAVHPVTVRPPVPSPALRTDLPEPAAPVARKATPIDREAERERARNTLKQARLELDRGHYPESAALFSEVEASGYERPSALTGLGEVSFQRGDYPAAVRYARRAVDAGAGVPARMVLGNTYFKLQKYDDAIGEYRAVLKIDASHKEAASNLAVAEKRKGG